MTGSMLQWVDTVRYLGMYLVKAKYLKCSLDYAKSSFHWAENSVFGKIGRIASEESVIQLIKGKCLPILLYGLETCPLKKHISDYWILNIFIHQHMLIATNAFYYWHRQLQHCKSYSGRVSTKVTLLICQLTLKSLVVCV